MSDERVGYTQDVLCGPRGGVILAPDLDAAIDFANDYAPEHLQILCAQPFEHLGRIENAGEILLGDHAPSVLGNFVIGPNHVLPTGGWARSHSPLSVFDFLKVSTWMRASCPRYTCPNEISGTYTRSVI